MNDGLKNDISNGSSQRTPGGSEAREDTQNRTAGSLFISAEFFEKIYLSPKNCVHGDLRLIVGNPAPLYVFSDQRDSGKQTDSKVSGVLGCIISLTAQRALTMG
ncbi:uncharacterized protein TRUGW13939_04576 [Talaromyces rugulosus]|uniref:Uncharacterized protein n=1 Tax=Talaromyces rugulosus TaxID=121627 RepID=A0A7H8QXD4_TALRU|nr:uncharacterized protein TRUGW13939_04576 [Talaromyces rugulosus]QKX57463.1 hypothetical protein TRUGW13939_04576 [Talaromyces rugulosus]